MAIITWLGAGHSGCKGRLHGRASTAQTAGQACAHRPSHRSSHGASASGRLLVEARLAPFDRHKAHRDRAADATRRVPSAVRGDTEQKLSGPLPSAVEVVVARWDDDVPNYDALRDACDAGMPDVDTCSLDLMRPTVRSNDTIAKTATAVLLEKSVEPGVAAEAWSRAKWLLGLLILQSSSSLILNQYEALIKEHLVVTLFLTMLVGAGGNAGNQSAIKVIRGLATGKFQPTAASMRKCMLQQTQVGLLLATSLSAGGFIRVYVTNGDVLNATSISIALFAIVLSSVLIGSGLPFALTKVGIDPANAGTSVQVAMDVLGVFITCVTCDFVLERLSISLGYV